MKLPSAEEYSQIIEKKVPGSLATLYNHRFILEDDGKTPLNKRSRKTIIFKTEQYSKFYAARFFLNDDEELFRRYRQIQNYLESKPFTWKVPFRFMDEEYYPVILMDWIDSLSFTEYLELIIGDPSGIGKLQLGLISLSQEIETNGIAHGNLNMKHIRFIKAGQDYVLNLIDYDSMFIPSFKEKDSFSSGTTGFQHPMRLSSDFSETIDRFSFWIFLTALEGFKIDPSLWKNSKENGFNKEEQILFTYRDIAFPHQSASFQTLRRYNSAALNFYCDKLISFCDAPSLGQIDAPKLYEEREVVPVNKKRNSPYEPKEISKEVSIKEPELTTVDIKPKKSITESEQTTKVKEENKNSNRPSQAKQKRKKEEDQQLDIPVKRNKKRAAAAVIVISILFLSALAYVAWNKQSKKSNTDVAAVSKPTLEIPQPIQKQEQGFFTSANITQFLFQLYQSYNKRDLSSILSNYADSLTQYYDAGAMQKSKLSDVIKNLFIKPVYYECHPDLTTLQFNTVGDSCRLTISINEAIQADRRSKAENYSSKIEYTIDSSFKILAEKNVE